VRDTHANSPGEEDHGKIRWVAETLNAPLRPQEDVYTDVGDVLGTHKSSRWLDQLQVHTSQFRPLPDPAAGDAPA